ncbi:MAG: hypothetical protein ACI93L_003383, partial [Cyclobacteriaceae bacterium]
PIHIKNMEFVSRYITVYYDIVYVAHSNYFNAS